MYILKTQKHAIITSRCVLTSNEPLIILLCLLPVFQWIEWESQFLWFYSFVPTNEHGRIIISMQKYNFSVFSVNCFRSSLQSRIHITYTHVRFTTFLLKLVFLHHWIVFCRICYLANTWHPYASSFLVLSYYFVA